MTNKKLLSIIVVALLCLPTSVVVIPLTEAGPTPTIEVSITADKASAQIDDEIIYTYKVINTGKVTLFTVSVASSLAGSEIKKVSESIRTNDKLDTGETWIFNNTYVVKSGDADPLINTATATANPRRGIAISATSDCRVFLYGTTGDMLPDVLTSPNQEPNGGWYGCSVAVGEGLIVVGAAYESIPNPNYDPTLRRQTEPMQIYGAGRAYVYSATTGALLTTLTSPQATSPGWFGYSVAVGDGVIVVGAPKETSGEVTLAGNAYVYDAVTSNLLYSFTTPSPVSDDNGYGYGVSVAVNDGIIAVGSSWETVNNIAAAGRVYLYSVADGTQFSFSPLVTPDPHKYGRFGISVALGEGVIAVGASYENTTDGTAIIEGAGRVYLFDSATGALTSTLISPNAEFAGHFGFSVAIGDGQLVIGAFDETANGQDEAGRAYIYNLVSETMSPLVSENPQYRGLYGNSVAAGDGLILVGAEIEISGGVSDAGNVYVYNTAGAIQATLANPDPVEWSTFGWSVAVGSNLMVVGAYDAVYVFE